MEERQRELARELVESKTQVGAVKRLIERVSSQSVGVDNQIRKRVKTSRNLLMRRSLS